MEVVEEGEVVQHELDAEEDGVRAQPWYVARDAEEGFLAGGAQLVEAAWRPVDRLLEGGESPEHVAMLEHPT